MPNTVKSQYERWPYPRIPLLAKVHRDQLWQINLEWIRSRCAMASGVKNPSIWIAGCGTFEPYVFSRANPNAQILATDFAARSLKLAERRCRWHGIRNVKFAEVDLENEAAYPDQKFDFIECYGVLMSLKDPLKALKMLSSRLKPDGILRVMVYPHYSRQRVFQVQRLATLLGLSFTNPAHPALLKNILRRLPSTHPLSYAFTSYSDTHTLEGIVDGFLHASDRGYSGVELCELIESAGLLPAFCFHRPWGQPKEMAEKLGLAHHDLALWLHYLDLWQSLRTNFTLCLVRPEYAQTAQNSMNSVSSLKTTTHHPLFNPHADNLDWRHRMRLYRLKTLGANLQTRTHDGNLKLSPKEIKNLYEGKPADSFAAAELLPTPQKENLGKPFLGTGRNIRPNPHFIWRTGKRVINPLYDYLFDAYIFADQWKNSFSTPLPPLTEQLNLWRPNQFPLEDKKHPFGLTPFATYQKYKSDMLLCIPYYASEVAKGSSISFEEVRLKNEGTVQRDVVRFLKDLEVPLEVELTPAVLRQLWILLYSFEEIFLDA